MSYLNGYRLHVLIMAVGLLPSLQDVVAAQTFLNPNHLPDFAQVSSIPEHSGKMLDSEVVDLPHMAATLPGTSPFLVKTSIPNPRPSQWNILAEIYFDWNRQVLKEDTAQILEHTAALLQKDPTGRVDLLAICDERGNGAYSLTLGRQRTRMLTEYLKSLGIPSIQMTQVSYGTQPPCMNQDPACGPDKPQHHKAFRLLAMASSRAGCLVQLRLPDNQMTRTTPDILSRNPFLQRIHLAETR